MEKYINVIETSISKKNKETLKINYKNNSSILCEIGKKYDTDKSSQRNNATDTRHCHPYTLFYDGLFKNKKESNLNIAELGIGGSLLMWKEYFKNSEIYGFDYNNDLINSFKKNFNNERITLSYLDIKNKDSIIKSFSDLNILYDIIIEDATNTFEDQIRAIENLHQYLKPGGVLIIEDIFLAYNENDYIDRLKPILKNFQDFYFVELDHNNRNSTGWNNDKLFILIKNGDEPIFKNKNKLTIITPSYRTNNLITIQNSINFDYVDEWIIVYDGSKVVNNPKIFQNNIIKEYVYTGEGISGNAQRNFALSKITNPNTILYYLDDDNMINPNLYNLMDIIDKDKIYTFNNNHLKGNNLIVNNIDTAMFMAPYKLCEGKTWILDKYDADFYYINDCYINNKNLHVFVDNVLCYYNKCR
jgi:predicted O-methyltransferase YrrM